MEARNELLRPKVGVAVFVYKEGHVLLGQRKGVHSAGEWAPPGGHLEFGETVEECAVRELVEETGLQAKSVRVDGWNSRVMDDRHYITFCAVVDLFDGEPHALEPDKCDAWRWCPVASLPSPMLPSAQEFFDREKEVAPHEAVLQSLLAFYKARDWAQFHSPKNLVMDLASEAGELLDLFRWMSEEQSYHPDPEVMDEIRDEIADVFKAILYLAHKLNIDPISASHHKFQKLNQKYPVEKCKGLSLKYTAYDA